MLEGQTILPRLQELLFGLLFFKKTSLRRHGLLWLAPREGRDCSMAGQGVTPWPAQGSALQDSLSPGPWLGGTIPGGDVTGGRRSANHPWPQSTCAFKPPRRRRVQVLGCVNCCGSLPGQAVP